MWLHDRLREERISALLLPALDCPSAARCLVHELLLPGHPLAWTAWLGWAIELRARRPGV
jgi:hypothetical protein